MWGDDSDESSASDNSEDEIRAAAADSIQKNGSPDEQGEEGGPSSDSDYQDSVTQEGPSTEGDEEEEEDNDRSDEYSSPSSETSNRRKKSSGKLDEQTRKLLEDNNYLRRSSRGKGSNSKKALSSEDEEANSLSDSDSGREKKSRKKQKKKKQAVEDDRYVRRAQALKKQVNYAEKDTDEDVDEDDVLEWEEEDTSQVEQSTSAENIEKVLKFRRGYIGATGSSTTSYNVEEKGDPNENKTGGQLEDQFLIKWVGWSHLHNTWESESSLNAMGAKGIKKLQNYVKKMKEIENWRATADKEYVEFFECEQVMNEELFETYKIVDRIVAHQVSRDRAVDGNQSNEYLVKWCGLSYADCTWEDERLLPKEKLSEYHCRLENLRPPNKNAAVLRKRPKFVKLETAPDFLQPPGRERQDLRDYQLEGLNWMLHAWCKGNSCILADEMGLGKTIQSISFLSTLHHRYELYGPFLVVVPLSTMAAWQKEFAQWAPGLNMITYMGDGSSREQIRQFEWYMPGSKKMKVNAVLTTYEILLKDKPFLGSIQWAALAVDEAHRLKNDESLLYKCLSSFDCGHRLLITGTPLQNSLKELWALLHFIMPEKFDSWEEFENDHNDQDHKGISLLHKKLEPFLLRRVKKDVEKSLPPKLEQILRVDMTAQQKQFYKWILTKNYRELSKGVKGSINGFVNLCMELKKCCNHASLVRQYDHFENDAQSRLQQLLKSSGKLILLDKLLCRLKDTGHRVLIFSQMVMMLDILQEYLQLRRFQTQRLDGSMRADLRKQALDHFNAEGSTDFCFLLSTRAGGLGINLATADTVIIFDSDWNPQNDLQAMSRAHRIGQTKTVNIYRLVTKASVEEEIVERAKRKLVLDHLVIQRMDTSGRMVLSKSSATGAVPFDKHELNDILKFGAAELFKEKEGEEQEPEVDIDRILLGAETRDAEEAQESGNDLLSSFKYANFAIDEEKDVAAAAAHTSEGQDGQEWDQIIPEEQRIKIEEEERRKAAAELDLVPRQRTKMIEEVDDGSGSESDSDAEGGKKKRKKPWGDFTGAEIKRFIRSIRKFSKPLERLEAIAEDAELEEHSQSELARLCEEILEGCKKAEEEFAAKPEEKDGETKGGRLKGPTFKFAGVDINVKQIQRLHFELEPLHSALIESTSAPLPVVKKGKPQKGWDVEWNSVDDEAILRGVFKYGMGNWEAIKMDPQLGLADKIFLKEKVKKPQRMHVQQRLEYLLKLMRKLNFSPKKHEARKRKHVEDRLKHTVEKKKKDKLAEKAVDHKDHKTKDHHHHHHRDKSFSDQLSLLHIDKNMYGSALEDKNERPFAECVKMMRPVQKYLKRIADGATDKEYNKCLVRLGDNCRDELEQMLKKKPKTNLKKWYNFMWIFVSKFVPQSDPASLAEKYKELVAETRHKHHKGKEDKHRKEKESDKHHHHHHSDKHKEKKKEKERKRESKDPKDMSLPSLKSPLTEHVPRNSLKSS